MSYKTYEVKVYETGLVEWLFNGQLHRENAPAVTYPAGEKHWFKHGMLHREDGPAIEYPNGTKLWYYNNMLHRLDGPAYEGADGRKEWWVDGRQYTEEEFNERVNSCVGKVVEIDGKKYRLEEV